MTEPTAEIPSVANTPPPGWYPDPWIAGHHRYWNGQIWSAESFPSRQTATTGPPTMRPGPVAEPAPLSPRRRLPSGRALAAILLVAGLLLGFGVAFGITSAVGTKDASAPPTSVPETPSPSTPATLPGTPGAGSSGSGPSGTGGTSGGSSAAPADTQAPALSSVILRQADVPSTLSVVLIPGGDQVQGETTLDLCNGTFPSEALRTARRQVAAVDAQGVAVLSTEAVLYRDAAASAQAFAELRSVAAHCPSTPVTSPVGEPTVTTHINAAPDAAWPQTPGVERVAYDFNSTDQAGGLPQHSVAVYLRHGRALLAVYFSRPDAAQPAISGQTTLGGIVNVFAQRLAQLPASVTG
jgi:Protein of unknown function (DUF2510)